MGVITSKGPNPFETNTANARYTQLSRFKNDWIRAGMISDAEAIFGRGYQGIYQIPTLDQAEIGDTVVLGNRAGVIKAFVNQTTVVPGPDPDIVTRVGIQVLEDLRALPADYQANPEDFGYVDSDFKTGRIVNYILVQGAVPDALTPEEILNGNINQAITPGSLLIFKKPTSDTKTWPQIAQDAFAFGQSFVQEFPLLFFEAEPSFQEGAADDGVRVVDTRDLYVEGATVKVFVDGVLNQTLTTDVEGRVIVENTFVEGEEITFEVTKLYYQQSDFGPYIVLAP